MKRHSTVLLILLVLCMWWVRQPSLSDGMPYFYNEDEAHHFNRVVNMVKSGDLNPHYFHKPSLHFYLRMPVVAASFLIGVKNGDLRSVKEIITSDPEGVGGYAFSASHPSLVKANRAFSVLLGILTALLCYFIAFEVTGSRTMGVVAFLFNAFSPELLRYGGVIGVDVVMTFFCVLTTYVAVRCCKYFTVGSLFLCAVSAGLAVSSKYNALPIVVVPLLLAKIAPYGSLKNIGIALAGITAGFFAGSPYIFAEVPLFLDQFAYEIWHYKIAGHEGHTGEPGWGQAVFYLKWLKDDALGIAALVASLVGFTVLIPRYKAVGMLVLMAPFLFFLLMIEQRANFTRNMTLILPYLAVAIAVALYPLFLRSKILGTALTALFLFFPTVQSMALRSDMRERVESRLIAEEWLKVQQKTETGVASDLEFARRVLGIPAVSRVKKDLKPIEIFQDGFHRFVSNGHRQTEPGMVLEKEFAGINEPQRIVENPHISVWKISEEAFDREALNTFLDSSYARSITFEPGTEFFQCMAGNEPYCWLSQRTSRIYIKDLQSDPHFSGRDGLVRLALTVMTPWQGQKVRFTFDDFLAFVEVPLKDTPGTWQTVEVDMPYQELKSQGYFIVSLSEIHSPQTWGIGADSRRLGLAVKDIRVLSR